MRLNIQGKPTIHRGSVLVIALVLCSLCVNVSAATEWELAENKLESELKKVNGFLKSVGNLDVRKGNQALKRAASQRKEVSKAIKKMDELAKGNSDLTKIVDKHERINKNFSLTLSHLAVARKKWDIILEAEEKCQQEDETLAELIKELRAADDINYEKNPELVNDAVEDAYDKIDDLVGDADLRITSIKKRVAAAKKFKADKPWDTLAKTIKTAGDNLVKDMEKLQKQYRQACDPILRGIRNEHVADFLDEHVDLEDEKYRFMDQSSDWLETSKSVFNTSCTAKKKLHKIASNIDWESNDDDDKTLLTNEINRQKSDIERAIGDLMSGYKDLNRLADNLKSESETDERRDLMRVRVKWFAQALKSDGNMFVGARDPLMRKILDYGVDMHDRMQSSPNCDLSEVTLSNRKRLDCFDAARCLVIEFKPNSSKSIAKGKKQVQGYARNLEKEFGEIIRTGIEKEKKAGIINEDDPRPSLNTIESISTRYPLSEVYLMMLGKNGCISDAGKVSLDHKVETYNPYNADAQLRCDDPLGKY